jgi:peptidoglycan/xylan/chitin deacetylase (PgdA/CDA1 family)
MNKYFLQQAARVLSPVLYYSGIHLLTKPWFEGMGQILMFHRVVPSSNTLRIHNHESLEVSPEYLENLISFFKEREYQFLSLDEVVSLKQPSKIKKKFVAFTFDDGYIDNLTVAYPILKKYAVPFTIYVATNMPDGTALVWWYLLEDLIAQNDSVEFRVNGKNHSYRTDTLKNKEISFNEIRSYLATANAKDLRVMVENLFYDRQEVIAAKTKELSLTWDQIKELSNDPLVTIGAHTVNHLPLDSLTFEESKFEILQSKKIIESHLAKEVKHFCYPIGSYGKKEVEIMQSSGYTSATTTKMANIFSQNLDHPFSLPRIMVNSLTTNHILTLQVNGMLPALRNKFTRVVT